MRRHLAIVTLLGLFGLAMMASDARACHKNKDKGCCAPAPVCYEPCPPPPPPVCEPCPPPKPKKTCGTCGGHHGMMGRMKCHRKAKMACAPVYAPVYYGAPVVYSAPQTYAAPQGYAAPQSYAAPQGMPGVPAKAVPQS